MFTIKFSHILLISSLFASTSIAYDIAAMAAKTQPVESGFFLFNILGRMDKISNRVVKGQLEDTDQLLRWSGIRSADKPAKKRTGSSASSTEEDTQKENINKPDPAANVSEKSEPKKAPTSTAPSSVLLLEKPKRQ